MPDLYRLSVGPINAAYYQKHFLRFETLGKVIPTWNNAAAFCTLAWLILRKMWRPAVAYAAILLLLLGLWWLMHGRLPLPVEAALCLITLGLLCAVPGYMGNALYYHHVRQQTLQTLTHAQSLAQARAQLSQKAVAQERLHAVGAVQALAGAAVIGMVVHYSDFSALRSTPEAETALTAPAPVGPPTLHIPSPNHVPTLPPVPALAQPPELSSATDVPNSALAPATPAAMDTPAAPPDGAQPPAQSQTDQLSIVNLAQSVPSSSTPPAKASTAPSAAAPAAGSSPPSTPVGTKPASPAPTATPAPAPIAATAKAAAPAKATIPPASTNSARLLPGKFYVNVGVYSQASNAKSVTQKLQASKLPVLAQTVNSNKGELTRLRIGPLDSKTQADQAAAKAKQLGLDTQVFQQPRSE